MTENVPETLSTVTPLPARKAGQWVRRTRFPRSLVRGERANTLPVIKPGERIFRVNPDPPDSADYSEETRKMLPRHRREGRATMRAWGLRNGYEVRARGRIPAEVQAAFMRQNDIWTVTVVSAMLPGAKVFSQHFHVRQGGYTRRRTIDPDKVMRELGPELYNLLWEVRT